MKILLTGRNGQVGWELERLLPTLGEVVATDRTTLDLADPDAIRRVVREVKPDVIVNAAAYTAVDKAEAEPELAARINGAAPGILAEEAKRLGALLVHYSTDYVFDGAIQRPYTEQDVPNPLSVYGKTKLAGEEYVKSTGCAHSILRVSWVYGGPNGFLPFVLRKAKERAPMRVVADQIGAPTWARDVAVLTGGVVERRVAGTWHASAAGAVSRFEYAKEILRLRGFQSRIEPAKSSEFPSAAARPAYSALDSRGLERAIGIRAIGHWYDRLRIYLELTAAAGR